MLRRATLLIIQLYWKLVPEDRRRSCIFRLSCSHYVYEVVQSRGATQGLKAFVSRWRQCRPGYSVVPNYQSLRVLLRDGSVADESDIAPAVLAPHQVAFADLRKRTGGS